MAKIKTENTARGEAAEINPRTGLCLLNCSEQSAYAETLSKARQQQQPRADFIFRPQA